MSTLGWKHIHESADGKSLYIEKKQIKTKGGIKTCSHDPFFSENSKKDPESFAVSGNFSIFAACNPYRLHIMPDQSLKRQLKVLTIPVFIEMALVMLLGAVDTVMLSRYSDNSVAAVGLDNQLMSLVFLVYQFFSMGAAILCAQYIGAGLRKRLVQVVGMALATRTYCHNIIMFVYLFCISITQGGDILVGHLVGQQRHQAAYILGNYFFRWSMIITLTGSALLALSGRSILSALTDKSSAYHWATVS